MYYFNEKRLALVFLFTVHGILLFSQEGKAVFDTLIVQKDSVITDTILRPSNISPDAVDKTITHNSKGYRRTDMVNKKVYLVGEGVVTYGDITLTADSIVLNMENGVVFAAGRNDTTGKVNGKPVFKQGSESFESDSLVYNFKSKKGRVFGMSTKQEEGYLRSGITKKLTDGSLNVYSSTYSTCELKDPHFYVGFKKAKVVTGKKIITGPAYMVLEDIPLPLVIPFGFFPIQKKSAASGLIIPKIGQTFELGYSLRDGGYYFAISDNIDLALTGNLYTNGTWMVNAASSYVKKYRYSGRFSLNFANNITGHKGLPDYSKTNNYKLDWNYTQDAKANPGSRFSASVSMSSSSYDQNNSYVVSEHVNATRQSSISYSRTWEGTPFNFSTSVNHSQNIRSQTVNLNLPKAAFTVSRIYPLKNKERVGPAKWYQELQVQYSATVDNQISTYDSLLFTKHVFDNMRNGFRHEIPLNIMIRPFKRINSFAITPQLSYSGVLFTQKIEKSWMEDYYDPDLNKVVPSVITDTLKGLFYGQAVNASVNAGLSPQIFGIYTFREGSRVQKIRHIIRPSIGFSYVPVLENLSTDMYRTVQIDTSGRTREYSIFEGNIYPTPSLGRKSGSVTFNLVNIVEAKVFQKNDTTGKPKNVKIIDNLSMGTAYNIFSDSLNWSPLSMDYRTTLFENINLSARSSFSFYGMNSKGATINTSYYALTGKPLRLTSLSFSFDLDIAKLFQKKKKGKENINQVQPAPVGPTDESGLGEAGIQSGDPDAGSLSFDDYGYSKFEMPWSLRASYNYSYSKTGLYRNMMQTIMLQGSLSLTKKLNITYATGYDIALKTITTTSIGIQRDLHCWTMGFNWIPVGYLKSWDFTIRIKASVLSDLKYERRKDFHDQY